MPDTVAATLEDKRTELKLELARLATPEADSGGISFGKRVGEGTSIAVERLSQVAVHDRLRGMLADVLRAQAKLGEGTYGACDVCGDRIAGERLSALPWATHCIGCASRR